MRIVHLTASTFYGGPERQMLGLARHLPPHYTSSFLSFREDGRCEEFLRQVRWNGFAGEALAYDTPNLPGAILDLTRRLSNLYADILLCHGYKANVIGRLAARSALIPAVAVSRGWTSENRKVRAYEALDRWHLRFMDQVVCVSRGQARKVRRAGVPPGRVRVIPNAARLAALQANDPEARETLESFFDDGVERIIVGAGRLSPEKGVPVLIDAAKLVLNGSPNTGFIVFGEGAQRPALERMIEAYGLRQRFILPGYRTDLDRLMPSADVFVLPSFTEGLPNVVLEASSAMVPVVATAVGGTPEVVADGQTGFLVPAGDSARMAHCISDLLNDDSLRRRMGQAGREHVREHFTFEAQARGYLKLFEELGLGDRTERRVAA